MRTSKIFPLVATCTIILISMLAISFQPALAQSKVTMMFHDVKVQPASDSQSYNVDLYFSLLDSAGNPIKDAALEDFKLSEDNKSVKIDKVEAADNEPINVALLLDTSNSMTGDKIEAARKAASKFIDDLQGGDEVAVLTFDRVTTHRIDFTVDHSAASQQVNLITPTPGAGTCLYDAAYETVQLASGLPEGRRAIILLTDGKDEAGGQPCSLHSLDEVIDIASLGKTRIPIYTIGLGSSADTQSLEQMARETGGRYQSSPGPTQLDALFGRLADELRSQYVVKYLSSTTPGQHTLILEVNYRSAHDEFSQSVEFPDLPYTITFSYPQDGATIGGKTKIAISISGQGAEIKQVVFLANSASIGTVAAAPYEVEWDPGTIVEGPVFLEAIAQDANGGQLARSGINISYKIGAPSPTETGGVAATPEPNGIKIGNTTISISTLIMSLALLVVVAVIVIVLVSVSKKRKLEKERDQRWEETVQGKGDNEVTIGMDDRTMDSFTPSEDAFGVLTVLESDDPTMRGQPFEITKSTTTLGKKPTNDIIFPKDSPVSRQHAVIEERNGALYISELMGQDDQGKPKRPTYGTFVNDHQIEAPVMLRDGDEIRLGKRVRLRFTGQNKTLSEPDSTIDQFSSDPEKTIDGESTVG